MGSLLKYIENLEERYGMQPEAKKRNERETKKMFY